MTSEHPPPGRSDGAVPRTGDFQLVHRRVGPIGWAFEDLLTLRTSVYCSRFHIGDVELRRGVFRLPIHRECGEHLSEYDPDLPYTRAELRISPVTSMRLSLPKLLWGSKWLQIRSLLWSSAWSGVDGPYWIRFIVWDSPHFLELKLSRKQKHSIELQDLELEYSKSTGYIGAARVGSKEYLRRSANFRLTIDEAAARACELLATRPVHERRPLPALSLGACRARIRWIWGNAFVVPVGRRRGPDGLDGLHVDAVTGEVRIRSGLGRVERGLHGLEDRLSVLPDQSS